MNPFKTITIHPLEEKEQIQLKHEAHYHIPTSNESVLRIYSREKD